jgi:vitamin B12 transporter
MRSLLTFCFCFFVACAFSQLADTLQLSEVTVYGMSVSKYATGSKVQTISLNDQVRTLSEGLSTEASLYLKNYGNQQLATIALRGTTASQTAVLWNGININSPTLGQTDFSLIPLFLFDDVSLHLGASSALYGSDAIGGAVMVGHSAADFKKGFHGVLTQQVGSFGRLTSGGKFSYGNERWHFRSKLYRSYIKNNFPYSSPAVGYRKTQVHAAVLNYGFDQQVHYKISDTQLLEVDVIHTDNDRDIQPAVTNDQSIDWLKNKNVRTAINYTNHSARLGVIHATTAYQFGDQDFFNGEVANVQTTQFTGQFNIDKSINNRSDIRYGLSYNTYLAEGENFDHITEGRYDAFASVRYALLESWVLNLNLRQTVYAKRYAPFTPTLGTEIIALNNETAKLTFRGQIARGYRVPTLDDRYWLPGGNPDTKPEDAFQVEAGTSLTKKINQATITLDGSYYKSKTNQMIVWLPDDQGVWTPNNRPKVHINGLEVFCKVERSSALLNLMARTDYSFTQSHNQEPKSSVNQSFHNKQLAYVPIHNARAVLQLSKKLWHVSARYSYTSLRYTTLDNLAYQSLSPYHLLDATMNRSFNLSNWSVDLTLDVNNILDQYYETLQYHAMPGRNYTLSLLIKF